MKRSVDLQQPPFAALRVLLEVHLEHALERHARSDAAPDLAELVVVGELEISADPGVRRVGSELPADEPGEQLAVLVGITVEGAQVAVAAWDVLLDDELVLELQGNRMLS